MAWSIVPSSGRFAPCAQCSHRDCDEMRATVGAMCPLCEAPIGYKKYCRDENGALVHFVCALAAAEGAWCDRCGVRQAIHPVTCGNV